MKKEHQLSLLILGGLMVGLPSQAAIPVWTFTPLTPTTLSVPADGTATVQYQITNQSRRAHTLKMRPQVGIQQITIGSGTCGEVFHLGTRGSSCVLSLQVNGNAIKNAITSGPVVCENDSSLQCYQPSAVNSLKISRSDKPLTPYAYVANVITSTISRCIISGTGELTDCIEGGTNLTLPANLTLRNNVLYAANQANPFITQCPLISDGNLGACTTVNLVAPSPLPNAFEVAFHPNGAWAYASVVSGQVINKCAVDQATGLLGLCEIVLDGVSAYGIAAVTKAQRTYLFFTEESSTNLIRCEVLPNGNLNSASCAPIYTSIVQQASITLNRLQNKIYFTTFDPPQIQQCDLNESGGLQNCSMFTDPQLDTPFAMSLNKSETLAYVTNINDNSVYKCTLNANGVIVGPCSSAGSSFQLPSGIAIN